MEQNYYSYASSPMIATSAEQHYSYAQDSIASPISYYSSNNSYHYSNWTLPDGEYKNYGYNYSSPYNNYYYKPTSSFNSETDSYNQTCSTSGYLTFNQQNIACAPNKPSFEENISFPSSCYYSSNSSSSNAIDSQINYNENVANTSIEYLNEKISAKRNFTSNHGSGEFSTEESMNNKSKKNKKSKTVSKKHQLPDDAVDILNEWFDDHITHPYPQMEEKERLARRGNITLKQVNAWFSNRRNRSQNTKPKRIQKQMESEINHLYQELVSSNTSKEQIIEKFRQTFVGHEYSN